MSSEMRDHNPLITTDMSRMDLDVIHQYLTGSYWAEGIGRELVARSMEHSLCFGVLIDDKQVGFARVVTDSATFGYLADVFILDSHQGRGLGKKLMEAIMKHPDVQDLRHWHLATRDAQTLYEKYGFTALARPERHMELFRPRMDQSTGTLPEKSE